MVNKKSRLLVLNYPFVLAFKKRGENEHSLIGGTIETGESPLIALFREVKEESGIKINEADIVCLGEDKMLKASVEHIRYYYQLVDIDRDFKLIETNKFESLEWVDFNVSKKTFKKLDQKMITTVFEKERVF